MGDSPNPFAPTAISLHDPDIGVIQLWSGSAGSIPPGWVLCDGNNGTLDLRDRFIRGAGGTDTPGTTGGTSGHTHNFTTPTHTMYMPFGSDLTNAAPVSDKMVISGADSGTTMAFTPPPPFYSLCYVMYLGN